MGSVLIVGNFLSGFQRNRSVCEDLAERLENAGWQVTSTSSRVGRFARLFDMLNTCWRFRRRYDVAQVDVYSGPAFFWASAVCWLLRFLHKPYALTLHGGNLPSFAAKWPRLTKALLQSAEVVTAPSGYLAEALHECCNSITVLPNAINLAAYPFRQRTQARPRLVWVRAFHEIYQPLVAVEALAQLSQEFPDVTLTMAGPDKHDGSFEAVQARAAQLNISDRIDYPGRVPKSDIPRWIDSSDIFINTSAIDNHPVTVLEAMACGACIVSTNPGGVPYLIQPGWSGILVPVGDSKALAEGVARILRNPEVAAALSFNARHAAETYDWSSVLPRWTSLLSSLVQKEVIQ